MIWDPTFSEFSYGFRPGRSAHGAISHAKQYVEKGLKQVVSIDLSKFFDRVNHDRLMSRLATKVHDKRLLKLIRKFLTFGVMIDGLVQAADEGTPQGAHFLRCCLILCWTSLIKSLKSVICVSPVMRTISTYSSAVKELPTGL